MRYNGRTKIAGLLLVTTLLWTASASKAALWHKDLADQMMADYVCEIGYLSQVKQSMIEGRALITARVHCLDGRAYDVRRHREAWFRVEPCQKDKQSC